MINSVAKFANQQTTIPLPGQVWQHHKGQEVKIEAIEYSRNPIEVGAIVYVQGREVVIAGDVPEDSVLVIYSRDGSRWARGLNDFLEVLRCGVNRYDLVFDPRKKRKEAGFTLVELIIVIVIIGILGAIAIPSFIGVSARARQAEGASNVGNLNKAQQAYYLENSRFAETLAELASGIPAVSNNYEFSSVGTNSGATSRAVSQASLPDGSSLQGFVGLVQLSAGADGAVQSLSIICASQPGVEAVAPAAGTDLNTPDACGVGQTRQ